MGEPSFDDTPLTFWTNRCKHQLTQGMPKCCAAGVVYTSLLKGGKRLPCFASDAFKAPMAECSKLERYTEEEARAERAEMTRAFQAFLDGRSPCCDAPLADQRGERSAVKSCAKCGGFVARECFDIGPEGGAHD